MPLNMSLRESMQQQEWFARPPTRQWIVAFSQRILCVANPSNIGITRNSPLPDAEPCAPTPVGKNAWDGDFLCEDLAWRALPWRLREGASVVSHKYGYEDARAFWLSARRDDL